jgi:aspartyl protease family protein
MTRFLVIAIVVLAALLLITAGFPETGSSLDGDDAMRMVYYGMLAALIGGGVLASQRNWGEAARNFGIWILIIVVLSGLYVFRHDAQNIASRLSAGLIPGRAAVVTDADGNSTTVLYMGRNGHYRADVTVDGRTVPMMVDTGASTIALSFEDAERLGLNPGALDFSYTVMTANGPARTAYTTLPVVSVGSIQRTNLRAAIAERGKLGESLLGMNFLGSLSAFTFSGDELRLRD